MPAFDDTLILEKPKKTTAKKQRPAQKVLFLNSHPIQYFAPLYKEMASRNDLDLTVLYCSKHGLSGETDREFGVQVKWDIPVLEGYRSVFLKNHAWKPGIYGFFGLMNLGIISYLFKAPKSTLIVHGWGYLSNILAIVFGKIAGHIVCIRGESPASHEQRRSARSLNMRKFVFGKILFSFADYFLFIGNENKRFYKIYGVAENKLRFAPYAVDNKRFDRDFKKLSPRKNDLRKALDIPLDKTVILFSGKYIEKKRPMDLLAAFQQCKNRDGAYLIFMGEGELRPVMERFIEKNNLQNIKLTGFVNQSKVAEYYAAADLFVMCSQEGETWGLSTNEAMNFHLPLLLSDLTGSSADLVKAGENGYVFKTGEVDDLAEKLELLLSQAPEKLREMGRVSAKIINGYSYQQIIDSIISDK
jgi:glycosyltransferase involved in cell wall biosynthesis